eukprot:CAMPEP_0118928770 /NCGR_PEP_ID=MMETSP1169-20130426/5948_1 /TAXON_ID=36882 /ORGANISM="Pyramimonas obovata, Strain CCMP722" /LENGTH=55 /DNA_ID=CAMNT_0006870821 /DNA_START=389 /DNA_END=552 /DNA_ORIENTATION=-
MGNCNSSKAPLRAEEEAAPAAPTFERCTSNTFSLIRGKIDGEQTLSSGGAEAGAG